MKCSILVLILIFAACSYLNTKNKKAASTGPFTLEQIDSMYNLKTSAGTDSTIMLAAQIHNLLENKVTLSLDKVDLMSVFCRMTQQANSYFFGLPGWHPKELYSINCKDMTQRAVFQSLCDQDKKLKLWFTLSTIDSKHLVVNFQ